MAQGRSSHMLGGLGPPQAGRAGRAPLPRPTAEGTGCTPSTRQLACRAGCHMARNWERRRPTTSKAPSPATAPQVSRGGALGLRPGQTPDDTLASPADSAPTGSPDTSSRGPGPSAVGVPGPQTLPQKAKLPACFATTRTKQTCLNALHSVTLLRERSSWPVCPHSVTLSPQVSRAQAREFRRTRHLRRQDAPLHAP